MDRPRLSTPSRGPSRVSPPPRPRAVLVGVQLPGVTDTEHASDLAELGRLVRTLGFDVAATITQRRDALAASAVLGEGKLKDLAELTGGKGEVPSGAPEVKTKVRARWAAERASGSSAGSSGSAVPEGEGGKAQPD